MLAKDFRDNLRRLIERHLRINLRGTHRFGLRLFPDDDANDRAQDDEKSGGNHGGAGGSNVRNRVNPQSGRETADDANSKPRRQHADDDAGELVEPAV